MRRRDVLAGLPAATLAACAEDRVYGPSRITPTSEWEGVGVPDDDAFPDGIQSGDPRPDSLSLWTHYAPDDGDLPLTVAVAVWNGTAWEDFATLDAPFDEGHEDAGTTHVIATGLPADTAIAYQFQDASGRCSRVGRGRTASLPGSNRTVRFGATACCSTFNAPFLNLTHNAARGDLDFFVWNGDTVYQDGADTVAEMRETWQENLRSDGFRAIHERTTSLYTWDDHEVDNDWGIPGFVSADREALGKSVFYEYACVAADAESPQRLYRSFRFGCAEVLVLDSRSEHDEAGERYLSTEQFEWLIDRLATSDATWKVVVNSVPIALLPDAYNIEPILFEHWNGYPAQRAALIEHIASNGITGVLFVSGDVHHPGLYRVDAEGPGSGILDMLVGPSGSRLNALGRLIHDGLQYVWSDAIHNSARFELRPEGLGHVLWVTDEDEAVAEAWFDVHGTVLSLDFIPPPP